jgi:hypothetical protein
MTSVIVIAVGLALVGIASADDGPAPAHARRSTTVYLSSAWSPGPTVPIRIGADGVVRTHRRGFALEARLGLGGAASVVGLGGQFAVHGGLALGGAFALGRRVVVAPMIAYDAFAEWEWYGAKVTVDYVTLELPISIVLDRGVVIEPFVQAGFSSFRDVHDPVIVIGPRLGIVL